MKIKMSQGSGNADGRNPYDNYAYEKENLHNDSQDLLGSPGEKRGKQRRRLSRRGQRWLVAAAVVVVAAGIGVAVALACASHMLHHMGFTSSGVARKSYASRLMSSTSQANNHTIPKDSWVSWLQRAGQKGLDTDHQAVFGAGGAVAGMLAAVVFAGVAVASCAVVRRLRKKPAAAA